MTKYDMTTLKVDLVGRIGEPNAMSQSIGSYVTLLKDKVDLNIVVPPNDGTYLTKEEQEEYKELYKGNRVPDITIHFTWPFETKYRSDCINIAYLPWGTSGLPSVHLQSKELPPEKFNWVETLKKADEIWSPNNMVEQIFNNSKLDVDTRYIPGLIDTNYWSTDNSIKGKGIIEVSHKPNGDPILPGNRKFVVGSIGDWSEAKNIESFLKIALVSLNPDNSIIVLKTHSSKVGVSNDEIYKEIIDIKKSLKIPKLPRIIAITDPWTRDDIKDFYNMIDLYMTTARADGAGLAVKQAMSMGCAVAAPGWSVYMDTIEHEKNGFFLPVTHEICAPRENKFDSSTVWYQGNMLWGQVNELESLKFLNMVHKGWEQDRLQGFQPIKDNARKSIVEKHSIEAQRSRVLKYLRKVQ